MKNAGLIIDIVAGVFILLNIGIGAFRGGLREILNLGGVLAACWTSFHYFRPTGAFLASLFNCNLIAAYLLGFFLLFMAVWLTFKLLSHLGTKLLNKSSVLSSANRLIGASIGAVKGIILVLLAGLLLVALPLPDSVSRIKDDSWTLDTIDRLKPKLFVVIGKDNPLVSLFDNYEKITDVISDPKVLVNRVKDVITDPDRRERLTKTPQVQKVLSHESARELISDKSFAEALSNNNLNKAMNNDNFQKLLKDPEFMDFLLEEVDIDAFKKEIEESLLTDEAATDDTGTQPDLQLGKEDEVARKIASIREVRVLTAKFGPAFEYLSNSEFRTFAFSHPKLADFLKKKDVQKILFDPKIISDLSQRKMTPLLQNPQIRAVLRDPDADVFAKNIEHVWKEWRRK